MSRLLLAVEGLGTVWQVEVFDEIDAKTAEVAYGDLCGFISTFEAKYSRFKADSVISRLNTSGGLQNPDPETLTLLRLGQKLYEDTGGVFNFLVGSILEARGYDAQYSFEAAEENDDLPDPAKDLVIDDNEIRLLGGKVDLGGFGKGYLIDLIAARLKTEHSISHYLINGGGDMYATSDHGQPIEIYLEHPIETGTYIAKTILKDQGFAASGTHKRRWKAGGIEYSHIVDTNDLNHHPDTLGIFTKAPSAAFADAWATTLLISDPTMHQNALTKARVNFARFDTTDHTLEKSHDF